MTEVTDLVYDRYIADEKLKHGTKYERLAAFVFKILDEQSSVIQNITLRSPGKRASHQIDVHVSWHGEERHVVIECRDKFYDNKIGEGDVRDFATVARQLEATGIMLTTTDFTQGARDVAFDEGIELGFLREFSDADWDGRVQQVNFQLKVHIPSQITVRVGISDGGSHSVGTIAVAGTTVVRSPDGEKEIATVVREALGSVALDTEGPVEVERLFEAGTVIDLPEGPLDIPSVVVTAVMTVHNHEFSVGPPGVAELLYQTLDGSVSKPIYDKELCRLVLLPDGTVEVKGDQPPQGSKQH